MKKQIDYQGKHKNFYKNLLLQKALAKNELKDSLECREMIRFLDQYLQHKAGICM